MANEGDELSGPIEPGDYEPRDPSPLAQRFLAQLQRDEVVPVAEVERMLAEASVPAFPAWLDFHERFAGYWESLGGGSVAIWGLALTQVSGDYGEPKEIHVRKSAEGVAQYIVCADAHPSWDYMLSPNGEFEGPPYPSQSFAIKVERNALMWAFAEAGPVKRVYKLDDVRIEKRKDQLLEEMAPHLVPEASDRFARYYASDDKILLEGLKFDVLKLVIRPS